jgi:hypothetical protein
VDPKPKPPLAVDVEELREGYEPPPRPQVIRPVQCPRCWGTDVRSTGTHDGIRYYRCRRCCDADGNWTRFKVAVAE